MAIGLCVAGFFLMIVNYQMLAGGSPEEFVKKPFLILVLIIPFLPAYFLAIKSKKSREQAMKALEPYYSQKKGG